VASNANRTFRLAGMASIDRRLSKLAGASARKVVRSGMTAGLSVLVKQMRKEVAAEPGLSPHAKKALKRVVNKRFKKRKRQDALDAKAGFAVGKAREPQRSGKNKTGVGIGSRNVHWFALGTKLRRVKSTGRSVGRIAQVKIISRATAAAKGAALRQVRTVGLQKLTQEVNRLRREG
jgi:hypothetical protein